VGQVVHTLPKGEGVCGVTSLDNEIFLLRRKERDQVEVYDVITYRLQLILTFLCFVIILIKFLCLYVCMLSNCVELSRICLYDIM